MKSREAEIEAKAVWIGLISEALVFCELRDLGFEGDIFTWRNHNHNANDYIR
jgi:hypothetical protein